MPALFLLPRRSQCALLATAGALYLAIILSGLTAEGLVRSSLIAPGAPDQTARAIAGALPLWRLGIAADLIMVLADVAIGTVFLRIFGGGFPLLAPLAFALRLVQAAVIAAALIPLALVPALTGWPELMQQAIALHRIGYDIALIFFAANCGLMAVMLRSLMSPLLPLALAGAGAVYLAGSLTALLAPALAAALQPAYALPLLAETALCLWLFRAAWRRFPATPRAA
ncbi:MAG: DUF4386 domain-containing protein [Pseudodonghicola sp.]